MSTVYRISIPASGSGGAGPALRSSMIFFRKTSLESSEGSGSQQPTGSRPEFYDDTMDGWGDGTTTTTEFKAGGSQAIITH